MSNDFYEDLVDYSEEFKEFFKKEFIYYHTISSEYDYINRFPYLSEEKKYSENNKEFLEFLKKELILHNEDLEIYLENYDFHKPKQSDDSYYLQTFFIFNNDRTIDIYNDISSTAVRSFSKTKIEMKKLKPYVKKDSLYRYLFD